MPPPLVPALLPVIVLFVTVERAGVERCRRRRWRVLPVKVLFVTVSVLPPCC